jgi:hypothetical protein
VIYESDLKMSAGRYSSLIAGVSEELSMAAGAARNHHWVPQCYLKGFAKSRSKNALLRVLDAVAQRHFTTVPRKVASARVFNRVEIDGVDPNRVEMDMAQFEGAVDKALERICRNRQILTRTTTISC